MQCARIFVKMYDDNGNIISKSHGRYDELFTKYGKRELYHFMINDLFNIW